MKNMYKLALLAALGLVSITSAQANNNDILVGFNDANGPANAQNDYVVDLGYTAQAGQANSITVNSSFTVDFSSSLYTTAFGADTSAANDVYAGVTGIYNGSSARTVYLSGQVQPGNIARTPFNNTLSAGSGIATGEYGSTSSSQAWTAEVGSSASFGLIQSDTGAPVISSLVNGTVTENLYEATQASNTGTPTAFSLIGSFDINTTTDTISFTGADVSAVPEPATYGLISGAGMLLLGLRRQFSRKA
jgi:hypothetical protein